MAAKRMLEEEVLEVEIGGKLMLYDWNLIYEMSYYDVKQVQLII